MTWLPAPERRPARALRAFHIGGYWRGPNDIVRHMMLGLREAGVDVYEYCTDDHPDALVTEGRAYDRGWAGPVWLRWDRLAEPIARFAPDVVVCNAGGLAFRPADAERLRQRVCLLGIALSDPDVFEAGGRHIAGTFDRYLTNAAECEPGYAALGVDVGVLPIATNAEFFRPVPPRPELACDVLVMGRAHPDRVEPVRALLRHFDVHLYGEEWDAHGISSRGLVFGEEALAALASARVTVLFLLTNAGHALVKGGLFDFAAAGAFILASRVPAVERYLRYGEEIAGFDGTEDLIRQVRYYLDHPDAATKIRRAGRARVVAEHTWPRVWPRILADLTGPLAR